MILILSLISLDQGITLSLEVFPYWNLFIELFFSLLILSVDVVVLDSIKYFLDQSLISQSLDPLNQ